MYKYHVCFYSTNNVPLDKLVPVENYGVKCMSMGFIAGHGAPIVWRGLMVMKAVQQLLFNVAWSNIDVLVLDLPPGTGDTQLSISQLLKLSGKDGFSMPLTTRRAV